MTELSGLRIALSAMQAQSRALEVAGHNVANASTDGYSRQRVDLHADAGPVIPALWSRWGGSGEGVATGQVSRNGDELLSVRQREAHASSTLLDARQTVLGRLEDIVGEPSDTGLSAVLQDLWSGFADVANHPDDLAARSALLQRAQAVTSTLGTAASGIAQQWSTLRAQLPAIAAEISSTAASVADLNGRIQAATLSGEPTPDLADQRDQLVLRLSELGGVTTRSHPDGTVDLLLGGSSLVSGTSARSLVVSGGSDIAAVPPPVTVSWADGGASADLAAGAGGAALEALNQTLPGWRARLDDVAARLVTTVNAAHRAGVDLDGLTGGPLLAGTTAATVTVAITDPRRIAAGTSTPLDGGNALALADLGVSATGPDLAWRSLVTDLGVAAQSTARRAATQGAVTSQVDVAVQSSNGVNIDEEMTSMLQFQRAYQAAAKVLTVMDDTLGSLLAAVR